MAGIPLFFRKFRNKSFLLLTIFPLMLTSCFFGQTDKQSAKEKSASEKKLNLDSAQLSRIAVPTNFAYSAILDDLDKSDLQNINRALTIFTNNKADSISRDSMLISFNEFMTTAMQGYYDTKLLGNKELIEHFGNKEDQSEAHKVISALASHGVKITFKDNDFYLEPDLEFVSAQLNGALTKSSRDYLETKLNSSKCLSLERNQSVSIPDSLAYQIIIWEDYLLKYPGYLMKDEIQSQYLDDLASYISGTEQLPLYDPATKILDPKYQSSYMRFIEEYPNRQSTKIVQKFYNMLTSKGYKYDEELDSILSEINTAQIQN